MRTLLQAAWFAPIVAEAAALRESMALPYPSRDDDASGEGHRPRTRRPARAAAGLGGGRPAVDLPAWADAAVFHPQPGGGLGNVGSRQLAGAAVQRRAVFAQDPVAAVADPCRLAGRRRRR